MPSVTDDTQLPLRTIVADDDPLVRRLIRDTLQMDGVIVIAEAANGREAVELALFYRPDVVVMDYMMPELDGIEATRRIYDGEAAISRKLAMQLVQPLRSAPAAGMGLRPVRSALTGREWEVLDLLSGGAS